MSLNFLSDYSSFVVLGSFLYDVIYFLTLFLDFVFSEEGSTLRNFAVDGDSVDNDIVLLA